MLSKAAFHKYYSNSEVFISDDEFAFFNPKADIYMSPLYWNNKFQSQHMPSYTVKYNTR